MKRKEKMRKGEWKGEKVSGAEKGEQLEVWGEKRRGSGEQRASVSMVTSSFRSTEIKFRKIPWTI